MIHDSPEGPGCSSQRSRADRRRLPRRLCGNLAGRGTATGHQPGRRCGALGCTRLRSAAPGGSRVSPALPPPRADVGRSSLCFAWRCKRGASLGTHPEKHMENDSENSGLFCPESSGLFLLLPPFTPQPRRKKLFYFFNSGESCAFLFHSSSTCAARPLLFGASPGEVTTSFVASKYY